MYRKEKQDSMEKQERWQETGKGAAPVVLFRHWLAVGRGGV